MRSPTIGHGGLILAAHALLGFALVAAALTALLSAVRLRNARTIAVTSAGAVFVIGAGFNGASFLDFASNTSSLIMAMLFALATLAYATILYVLPPQH
jgi:membrane-associated PAP2 superfamily phosphatase